MLSSGNLICEKLTAPTRDNTSDGVLSSDAKLTLLDKLVVSAILHDDPIVPLHIGNGSTGLQLRLH
jgi:hypothetical protein